MQNARLWVSVSLVSLGLIAPASAAWDHIGAVDIHYGRDYDRAYTDFGGPIERLRFSADTEDLYCRSIRVTFGNNQTREVFAGNLKAKEVAIVDLPGDERYVERIDFVCSTASSNGALILIAADLGEFRTTWLQQPYWADQWKHNEGATPRRWVSIGSEEFTGERDRETEVAGVAGRSVTAVALKPTNGDVVCPVVRGQFGDGNTRDLNLDWGEYLEEDRFYWFDLPGNDRNLLQVDMVCRTVGQQDVTVQLFVAGRTN
jgi:hypothetical protein